ncbi:MAG: GNAT family N-acetyltransferase [Rhizobiales bacterium]|nr:GNAT family N-acetyltransferase [Hyphomicrobiales bacterium]
MRLRPAREADVADLAALMDIASHGIAARIWCEQSKTDVSPLETGIAQILGRKLLPSFLGNWVIASSGGRITGAYAGYIVPEPFDPGDSGTLHPVHAPLLELEALSAAAWFLVAIAVYPQFRRRGHARAMLRHAESAARGRGARRMAMALSGRNDPAMALYAGAGFEEAARRPRIGFSILPLDDEWVLMSKALEARKYP